MQHGDGRGSVRSRDGERDGERRDAAATPADGATGVTDGVTDGVPEAPLPSDTSPTWELELLISGAVIFALFQLPGPLDTAFETLLPSVGGSGGGLLTVAYMYAKAILYALIGAFVVHLAARAYWVGLVGLRSVYPQGIRWERTRLGPVFTEVYRARIASLRTLIERTDNFCSIIFGFAFSIVLVFALSILGGVVALSVAWVISQLAFDGRHTQRVFYAVLVAITAPAVIGGLVDRSRGGRIGAGTRAGRLLRTLARLNFRTQMAGVWAPISLTLWSNIRHTVIYPIFSLVFVGLLGGVLVEMLARVDVLRVSALRYVPVDADAQELQPEHYESMRPSAVTELRAPFIQSDIIRDPYVRLFIPYSPTRHNDAIAERCPGLQELRPRTVWLQGRRTAAPASDSLAPLVLRCLAEIHRVTLDGRLVDGLAFRFHEHPRARATGIIGYIPTAGLARGVHELRVEQAPRPAANRRPDDPPLEPYVIPFWL